MSNYNRHKKITQIVLIVLACLLAAIIFGIDINTPLGIAVGACYSLVVLYSWLLTTRYASIITAFICTILIFIGFSLSPESISKSDFVAINRIISIVVVWICGALVLIAKQSLSELEEAKNLLEEKVIERTYKLNKQQEELRKNALELEAKNKELEQFAYIASHDLQEPLRTVSSFVDLLHKEYVNKLDENGVQYLQFISEGSQRMRDLVKGLLDYSRIGKEREKKKVDLNNVIKVIKDDLKITIEEKQAQINTQPLPTITCFPTEVRQLFQNLISNALKFQEKNNQPVVQIKAEKKNGSWMFSVKDNGIGIAKEHQEKVFKIFQRLHTRKQFKGTGIGLAHCQKIVELHHGKIWVESEKEKGTTFYFTLNGN